MSALNLAFTDSATMLRRNLLHARRYPSVTIGSFAMPIILMLLFVGVLGDTLSSGLNAGLSGGADYIEYITPGIIVMTIASGSMSTAIAVCTDMSGGIIARFRTMAISRASVMTGHVLGSMIMTVLSVIAVVLVAMALGFRPHASVFDWLAAFGLVAMVTFALTWITVAIGLISKTPEEASNVATPLYLLPFISSAFVPTESMPTAVAWFAQYQPFTPMIETMRGLLLGTPIGNSAVVTIAWCAVITLTGFLWARAAYDREPAS